MKISWSWLSDYVDLEGLDPDEVARALTMAGLEVDGVERLGEAYEPLVIGRILSIEPHPDADKLVVCRVDVAEGEPRTIVCGASNMVVGDRVPVIPAGRRLPGGQKIKKGKIRGQLSEGMMCSADELELGDDHSGLLILSPDAPVGGSVAEHLGLRDVVIELSLTPNRGDCLSHVGVAREVAALFGRKRSLPGALGGARPTEAGDAGAVGDHAVVEIEDIDGCPRYAAAVVRDVVAAPSPRWLARRLEAIGQRPVNNLVDATNYVMFETGQPLHAFDLEALAKDERGRARIVVRQALPGETMESIDHVTRELDPDDVVITDGSRAVAVAGVMGGVDTEVSERTRHILLECAHFNPRRIRRSAKRLAMATDSSHRFERTVDIAGVPVVLERLVEVLLSVQPEEARPRVARGLVDNYPAPVEPYTVSLRPARCRTLLGVDLEAADMARLLESIDLGVRRDDAAGATRENTIEVEVPTFRPDLEREVDLIEEVGRLYGLDRIEATLPAGGLGYQHRPRPDRKGPQTIVTRRALRELERIRDRLADCGLLETVNYAFVSPEAIGRLGFGAEDVRSRPIELANPLSEEWSVMRTSLLAWLLLNLRHNLGHQQRSVALYELGPTFVADASEETGVRQELKLGAVLSGRRPAQAVGDTADYDGFDLRTVLDGVADDLGVSFEVVNHVGGVPELHPGVGAIVRLGGRPVGFFGQLHPDIGDAFDIDGVAHVMELDLQRILDAPRVASTMQPIPRYPAAWRDVALVVDAELPYSAVEAAVAEFTEPTLESVELASIYSGEPIPPGKKSIALSMTYRSAQGSLTDQRIDAVHGRFVEHLGERIGGVLR